LHYKVETKFLHWTLNWSYIHVDTCAWMKHWKRR